MGKTASLIAGIVVVVCGCSGVDSVDPSFSLVETPRVEVVAPDPQTPDLYEVTVAFQNRYAGWGHVAVCATTGGEVVSPDGGGERCAVLGLTMAAGTVRVPIVVKRANGSPPLALDVFVSCDSLATGAGRVHWQSQEGRAIYAADVPRGTADVYNDSYLRATIINEGDG